MSAEAIVMMIVSMLIIWGGLVVALLNLRNAPDPDTVHRDL
jgi:hypothetical protein